MSRRRLVIEVHDRDVKVRGWGAADHLRAAGLRPYFAGDGWWISMKHLPDAIAWFDYQNIAWREQVVSS